MVARVACVGGLHGGLRGLRRWLAWWLARRRLDRRGLLCGAPASHQAARRWPPWAAGASGWRPKAPSGKGGP
eukprot:157804-Prymnesium_polylepis.1